MARLQPSSMLARRRARLSGGRLHWPRQVAAEFFGEIDRHASVNATLAIQERRTVVEGYDCPVPDVRMDVEAAAAVTPERTEPLRCHIVPRKGERHDKTLLLHRAE